MAVLDALAPIGYVEVKSISMYATPSRYCREAADYTSPMHRKVPDCQNLSRNLKMLAEVQHKDPANFRRQSNHVIIFFFEGVKMDSELIIAALGKQLDSLNSLVGWAVGLALITAWAGLQRQPEISLLSMKVARKDALYLLGAAFLYVNLAAIVYFVRIGDLIALVEQKSLPKALTVVGTNAWAFNPYAYFGDSFASLFLSNFGYGALIVIWWIGYTALSLVQDDKTALDFRIVIGAFLAVGLVSMGAIQYGFGFILIRVDELDASFRSSILGQVIPRTVLTFVGIGLGGLIFALAQKIQRARHANPENNSLAQADKLS
jgi:hypothetical protein